jgi:hypothetical protein
LTIEDGRFNEFFLFCLLKKSERHAAQAPALRERHLPFVDRHSMKLYKSGAAGLISGQFNRKRN